MLSCGMKRIVYISAVYLSRTLKMLMSIHLPIDIVKVNKNEITPGH